MVKRFIALAAISALAISSTANADGLSRSDVAAVQRIPAQFTAGWRRNDEHQVMGLFLRNAVFIPHDGVTPHRGWSAIKQFWFPGKGSAGTVTAFTMTAEGVSGSAGRAIVWGKSDLHWQDQTTAYHWLGHYLMAVERHHGRWLISHLVSSDEQPTTAPVLSH